ncbi:MAG: thioredoxin-disulfide reductase [Propionibacteriaceae bacterium]|jgi:thioredoxin reductase (NADPH)|nr:thioredoxin-disulfide reductase [Propionibacteriaceae bacterium]
METRDVIIIGSGPAGYTAGIYTARAGLKPLLFEGSIDAGGALMTTTEVENYPGYDDGVMGPDLMLKMRAQAAKFGTEIITDDIVAADLAPDPKKITDSEGNEYFAKAVILAMGAGYRKLGLPDEERLTGRGVSWCATCDGFFFRDKDVAVVGGGDSALEEAMFLTRFANKVTIVHRRDTLRAEAIEVERAKAEPKIAFAWNSVVSAINGDNAVASLTLRDTATGAVSELPVSGVFVAIGAEPRSGLVKGQVDLDESGYVKVAHPSTATNLPGVFACGDLVNYQYRQAVVAAGDGAKAALDVQGYLHLVGTRTTSEISGD